MVPKKHVVTGNCRPRVGDHCEVYQIEQIPIGTDYTISLGDESVQVTSEDNQYLEQSYEAIVVKVQDKELEVFSPLMSPTNRSFYKDELWGWWCQENKDQLLWCLDSRDSRLNPPTND
jgi:hypothetical protein